MQTQLHVHGRTTTNEARHIAVGRVVKEKRVAGGGNATELRTLSQQAKNIESGMMNKKRGLET